MLPDFDFAASAWFLAADCSFACMRSMVLTSGCLTMNHAGGCAEACSAAMDRSIPDSIMENLFMMISSQFIFKDIIFSNADEFILCQSASRTMDLHQDAIVPRQLVKPNEKYFMREIRNDVRKKLPFQFGRMAHRAISRCRDRLSGEQFQSSLGRESLA